MQLLNEKEIKYLDHLSEILNYGSNQITDVDLSSYTHLQNFLVFNHFAIHNYSEAIYLLCKDCRPHSASVILRSIFEAYVNIEYVKIGDTEKKLALFSKEGFIAKRTIANEFKDFLKKYTHKINTLDFLNENKIAQLKEFSNKYISNIEITNGLDPKDKYPDLLQRSREIDDSLTNNSKGDYELYYHLVYRFLSPFAHLNSSGLESFVKEEENKFMFDMGQSKDSLHIISQTYLYYYSSLNNLLKEKIILNIDDKFTKYYTEIHG